MIRLLEEGDHRVKAGSGNHTRDRISLNQARLTTLLIRDLLNLHLATLGFSEIIEQSLLNIMALGTTRRLLRFQHLAIHRTCILGLPVLAAQQVNNLVTA